MSAGLTDKQALFVREYLACLNAAEAARRAGYSEHTARQQGQRLLTNVDIVEAVRIGLAERAMPTDEVLTRLADIARGDMGDFLRIDEEEITLSQTLAYVTQQEAGGAVSAAVSRLKGEDSGNKDEPRRALLITTETVKRPIARLDLMQAGRRGLLRLVKKYSLDDKGKVAIELYSAQDALNTSAKIHGLLKEQSTNLNVTPDELKNMSDEDFNELARKRGLL